MAIYCGVCQTNGLFKKAMLSKLAKSVRVSWMVIGNFNEILMAIKKLGRIVVDNQRIYHFAR